MRTARSKTCAAAGGFFDGRGLAAALSYGAAGVGMGTRFLLTSDSPVGDEVKQVYLGKTVNDTLRTTQVDGVPHRVLRTDFTEHLDDPKREVTFFDPNVGAFVSRRAPKVYHLNLVLRYQTEGATDVSFERGRAIVSRKGIVRVDVVLPRTAASALAQTLDPVA